MNISSLQTIIKQEEETIRDFTRRFEQATQQVEIYNMDVVLQNFRKSFVSSTSFFHSLSLDPPATMEELYRWADRYSILEDNICATTQTVMIASKPVGNGKPKGKKSSELDEERDKNHKRPRDQPRKKREPRLFTPLNITYERLLPLIHNFLDSKWPAPIQTDPPQRNPSMRCDYHRDHGNETNKCRSLNFLI